MKPSALNKVLLLLTSAVAAYEVVAGFDAFDDLTSFYFTVAFGVLILASLLIIIFGFNVLNHPWVASVSALVPLSFSAGLIKSYLPDIHVLYLAFALAGLLAIALSKRFMADPAASIVVAGVHGVAGIVVVALPVALNFMGRAGSDFLFISLGGLVIGSLGIMLALSGSRLAIFNKELLLSVLPFSLFLTTLSFVMGLSIKL